MGRGDASGVEPLDDDDGDDDDDDDDNRSGVSVPIGIAGAGDKATPVSEVTPPLGAAGGWA